MTIPKLSLCLTSDSFCLSAGKAVNGAGETRQGRAIEYEIDTDRQTKEAGAGGRPGSQQIHTEKSGYRSREHGPAPPGKLERCGAHREEHASPDEETREHHATRRCAPVGTRKHQTAGHSTNDR